ncbi:MAG: DUF445 family protein [Bacteroidota bacterium]
MPDTPSGSRRYVPVPGVPDLDAVEDANFADAFGEDEVTDDPAVSEPAASEATASGPVETESVPEADPASPPLDVEALPVETVDPVAAPEAVGTGARTVGVSVAVDSSPPSQPPPAGGRRLVDAGPVDEAPPLPPGEREGSDHLGGTEAVSSGPPPLSPPVQEGDSVSDVETIPEAESSPVAEDAPQAEDASDAESVPEAVTALVPPREVVDSAKEATRSRGRELVQLVVTYGKAHVPEAEPKPAVADTGPPRMVGRVGQLIPVLRVVPWLLAAVFVGSFWWDFDGVRLGVFGQELELAGLLRILAVSGLIGFLTNWLAITMLFQPRAKRAIIPQGLIPAQRERVIYRLSEAISRELINADIIKQKIQESGVIGRYRDLALGVVRGVVEDPGFRADLKGLAQSYAQEVLGSEAVRQEVAQLAVQKVEEQAGQGLGGVALKLYRTFAEADFQRRLDRALDDLPNAVAPLLDRIDTALDAVPKKAEARADEIEEAATKAVLAFVESFDIRSMIQEKARGFDEAQLESLLKSTSNEQLNYIKYLGAILGVFGGLVIWQPLGALAVFAAIGLVLWALDEALVRARRG